MTGFRSGRFVREDMSALLRRLSPSEAFHNLSEVDLRILHQNGKRLVLLDVDNTLLRWKSEDIPQETFDWIREGRALGLEFCIISNTRRVNRLGRLSERLGVPYVRGKFKPSREMFDLAVEKFGVTKEETVMVGDQIFTDILGANRAGIDAIWVKPIHPREFISTRMNRIGERFITRRLYRYLDVDADDTVDTPRTPFLQRKIVRQFAKFCIVGGTSFAIDAGVHKILMFYVRVGGEELSQVAGRAVQGLYLDPAAITTASAHDVAFTVFKIPSAALAILNSFIWNRMWTFSIRGKEERGKQFSKFVLVSVIGLGLNVLISSGLNRVIGGTEEESWLWATVIAAAIVALWNFSGQRLWAFRKKG